MMDFIKQNNNSESLYYNVEKESFNFFYEDKLLFSSSNKSPFITVFEKVGDLEKITPLFNCRITRIKRNLYYIVFNNKGAEVNCEISAEKGIIKVNINSKNHYEKIRISINKSARIVSGFGCNDVVDWSGKSLFSNKATEKDQLNGIIEKDLCFEVRGLFKFLNQNITNWQVQIDRFIDITTDQNEIEFKLNTNVVKEPRLKEKEPKYLLKTDKINIEEIKEKIKEYPKIDGIILDFNIFNPKQLLAFEDELSKINLFLIFNIDLEFIENTYLFNYFNDSEKEAVFTKKRISLFRRETKKTYITSDVKNAEIMRKIRNIIRSIFDVNCHGILLNCTENINRDITCAYLTATESVATEYGSKHILYNKMNPSREKSCYLVKDVKANLNMKNVIRALKSSGIKKIAIENGKNLDEEAKKYIDYVVFSEKTPKKRHKKK